MYEYDVMKVINPFTKKEEELRIYPNDWIWTDVGQFAIKHIVFSVLHIYTIGMDGEGNPYIMKFQNVEEGDMIG